MKKDGAGKGERRSKRKKAAVEKKKSRRTIDSLSRISSLNPVPNAFPNSAIRAVFP